MTRAAKLAVRNGGKQNGAALAVRMQSPRAARFEEWKGRSRPMERISVSNARWTFRGQWEQDRETIRSAERSLRTSAEKGAEAIVAFEGTGVVVSGPFLPTCGKAEFLLDNRPPKVSDCYPGEDRRKVNDSMFHAFGLAKASTPYVFASWASRSSSPRARISP